MKLVLQPHKKNEYPLEGIVIKGNSPLQWLHDLQRLDIDITSHEVFPIPSLVANEVYGCLVVINISNIREAHKYLRVQLYEDSIFIPEFASISPLISKEEIQKLFGNHKHFFHPELGFIVLEEKINWGSLLNPIQKINVQITSPDTSVFIPKDLKSIHIEYDEETVLEALENPLTEEEKLEKLPFNLKKLMAGNKKEMEKFLAYMEQNPDKALKYALPLDTLGTSRGSIWSEFSFGGSFLERFSNFFGLKNTATSSQSILNSITDIWIPKIFAILFYGMILFAFFSFSYWLINSNVTNSKNYFNSDNFTSNIGEIFVVSIFIISIIIVIIRLIINSQFDLSGKSSPIYKILMIAILLISLYYLTSFLHATFGLLKWHSLLILAFIVLLVYKLFHVNKEIFKDEK
jgi:hypothetical protein